MSLSAPASTQKPSTEESHEVAGMGQGQLSCTHTTACTTVLWAGKGRFPALRNVSMNSAVIPDRVHPSLAISGSLPGSWPSAAACTMSFDMVSGGHTCRSHQHGAPRQQSLTITRISGHGTDMDPGFMLAWGSSMDHRHQHSLQWHHRPHWSLEEVQYSK